MSENVPIRRSRRSGRKRKGRSRPGSDYLPAVLIIGLVLLLVGAGVTLAGHLARPVIQSLQAALPPTLISPGRGVVAIRLRDPLTKAALAGEVSVLLKGRRGRYLTLGRGGIKGRGQVKYAVPGDLDFGGYTLVARVEGARKREEVGHQVDVLMGGRLNVTTARRHYLPGDEVRFIALGTLPQPRWPAAGQSYRVTLEDPQGLILDTRQGETSAEGMITGSFRLPHSARGGNYVIRAMVEPRLFGSCDLVLPEVPPDLRIQPLPHSRGYAAGREARGRVALLYPDGSPCTGLKVEVVLSVPGWEKESRGWARAAEPGLYTFQFQVPRPTTGAAEKVVAATLTFRVPLPGSDKVLTLARPTRVYPYPVEIRAVGPFRWVAGRPGVIRVLPLLLDGRVAPARIEAWDPERGKILARAGVAAPASGPVDLEITPDEELEQVVLQARSAEGEVIARRPFPLRLSSGGYELSLDRRVLSGGKPLAVKVRSTGKEGSVLVGLANRGMTTSLYPVELSGGEGSLVIPPGEIPEGFFSLQAWSWGKGIEGYQELPLFSLGLNRVLPPPTASPGRGKGNLTIPERADSRLFHSAWSWPLDPALALPFEFLVMTGLTWGQAPDLDLHRLTRSMVEKDITLPNRQGSRPRLRDSWVEAEKGRLSNLDRLYEASLWRDVGFFICCIGGSLLLFALLLGGVGFLRARQAVLLLLAAGGLALAAPAQGGGPEKKRLPVQVPPFQPPPLSWGLVPPGGTVELEARPDWGRLFIEYGGQSTRSGGFLYRRQELDHPLRFDLRCGVAGVLSPGDVLDLPLWVKAPAGTGFRLGERRIEPGPPAGGGWFSLPLSLGFADLGGKPLRLEFLDSRGRRIGSEGLPLTRLAPIRRRTWRGGRVAPGLRFTPPAGTEEVRVELFSHPIHLASAYLEARDREEVPAGTVDQVLGRGRIALALLEALERPGEAPARGKEIARRARAALEAAWLELSSFLISGGTSVSLCPGGRSDRFAAAATLEFLLRARPRLGDDRVLPVVLRLALQLRHSVSRDGTVQGKGRWGTMSLWQADPGRIYLTARVGAALARFYRWRSGEKRRRQVVSPLLIRKMGRVTLGSERATLSSLENFTLAAMKLVMNRQEREGLAVVHRIVQRQPTVAEGGSIPAWTGAAGDRAALLLYAEAAAFLAREELDEPAARRERALKLLDLCGLDYGWGDEWTTAACLEAILPLVWPPEGRVRVRRGETRLAALTLRGRKRIGPLPAGGGGIEVEGDGEGTLALARYTLSPTTAGQLRPGALEIGLQRVGKEPVRVGGRVECVLTVKNRLSRPLTRLRLHLPRSAPFHLLSTSLRMDLARRKVARIDRTPAGIILWIDVLAANSSELVSLEFIARAAGRLHLPPVRGRSLTLPGSGGSSAASPILVE